MDHGDYLSFKLDWARNEMQVSEIGPVLQSVCTHAAKMTFAIPPPMRALDCLAELNPQAEPPYHYLFDVLYDKESFLIKIHCAESYTSVVDVPRERLMALLCRLLTPREIEVTILLFEGDTIRYIASTLHIAEGTVKRTIYNIYRKIGVGSQVELVREIYARLAQM